MSEHGGTRQARRPRRKLRFRLLCFLNRHQPAGHRANWNGAHYISRCEYCNQSIKRVGKGKWVLDGPRQKARARRRLERQRAGRKPQATPCE